MVNLEQNKLGYKMKNNLLLLNLANVLLTDRIGKTLKKQHRYSTRQKEHPNLPNHCSKLYNDSFLVQSIKSYNNLNADIKNLKTLYKFAATIKESAIMSYNK